MQHIKFPLISFLTVTVKVTVHLWIKKLLFPTLRHPVYISIAFLTLFGFFCGMRRGLSFCFIVSARKHIFYNFKQSDEKISAVLFLIYMYRGGLLATLINIFQVHEYHVAGINCRVHATLPQPNTHLEIFNKSIQLSYSLDQTKK